MGPGPGHAAPRMTSQAPVKGTTLQQIPHTCFKGSREFSGKNKGAYGAARVIVIYRGRSKTLVLFLLRTHPSPNLPPMAKYKDKQKNEKEKKLFNSAQWAYYIVALIGC